MTALELLALAGVASGWGAVNACSSIIVNRFENGRTFNAWFVAGSTLITSGLFFSSTSLIAHAHDGGLAAPLIYMVAQALGVVGGQAFANRVIHRRFF